MGSGEQGEVKISGVKVHRRVQKILQMTATCRQIRSETHLLFFRLQVFYFGEGMLQPWLKRFTAEQCASISHVCVVEMDTRRGFRSEFWGDVGKLHSLEKLVVVTRHKATRGDMIILEYSCLKKVNKVLSHNVKLVVEQRRTR